MPQQQTSVSVETESCASDVPSNSEVSAKLDFCYS